MMTPYDLAQQARERAVHNYMAECDRLTIEGDAICELDPDGAQALYLDAMKALDCAQIASLGLNLQDKENA